MQPNPRTHVAGVVEVKQARVFSVPVSLARPLGNARTTLVRRAVTFVELTSTDGAAGYGEVCALPQGAYIGPSDVETVELLKAVLGPCLGGLEVDIDGLDQTLGPLADNPYARAAIESAVWHLLAQQAGTPLWKLWGGTRTTIPFGAHIAPTESTGETLASAEVSKRLGAQRLRIKVSPGTHVGLISDLRSRFPEMAITVDCNGSFDPDSPKHRQLLEDVVGAGTTIVEQPFDHTRTDVLERSATLQAALPAVVALDESIASVATARTALETGACKAINIKAPRIGGYARALEMCELVSSFGAGAWCGGMYETDLGRAFNLNLMSRQEFDLPGDGDPPSLNYSEAFTTPRLEPNSGYYHLDSSTCLGGWEPSFPDLAQE